MEIWKKVKENSSYEVSNYGKVRSLYFRNRMVHKVRDKPKYLTITTNNRGYDFVYIYKNNKRRYRTIHSLVLESFNDENPVGMQCCHNDGNPQNNHIDNLRWDTHFNNQNDKVKHGTRNPTKNNQVYLKRMELKLTQNQFSSLLGMGLKKHTISRWETGFTKIPNKILNKLEELCQ